MKTQKGFTLVEILIVVSLIAILAVVALITINPAEAQRRARDTQRIKDISSLQSIIEQYLSDNSTVTGMTEVSGGGTNACGASGWTGIDLCAYANTLPTDPTNRATVVAVTDAGGTTNATAQYSIIINDQGQYRICARMESRANVAKMTTDGEANNFFEVFSYTGVDDCS